MNQRKPEYPITPLIINRWSPRAMSGESISEEDLMSLFEAARWAPSSFNNQPWRFIYGKRNTPYFQKLFDLLTDSNQRWCKKAAVLVVILSSKYFEHNGKPSITHSLDTGAAWENIALEGSARDLVVHGIQGFDYERAKNELNVPDEFEVKAMFAIGKKTSKESLPPELQEKESPSTRKPLSEIISEGVFNFQIKKSSRP